MDAIKFLRAWSESIEKKSQQPLASFLDDGCSIEYIGRKKMQTKSEHLAWCVENTVAGSIDDFKIFYDGNGVCSGSHGVNYTDGSFGIAMFFDRYYKNGIEQWTSLVSKNWK